MLAWDSAVSWETALANVDEQDESAFEEDEELGNDEEDFEDEELHDDEKDKDRYEEYDDFGDEIRATSPSAT